MSMITGTCCSVEGCHNRSPKDGEILRHYYRLPAIITNQGSECETLSTERRRLWLASLNQDFTGKNLANVRVCSDHFVNKNKASLYQRDSPDWVPTISMSTKSRGMLDTKSAAANARYTRKVQRHKKRSAAAALKELSPCDLPEESLEPVEPETGVATQTDIDQPLYLAMAEEIQYLRTENIDLKEQVLRLSNSHKIEEFRGRDDKVKNYTGLPTFEVLSTVYNDVEKDLPKKKSLDKFQFLIMCLMRMRLNLPLQFLAFEFCISVSSASRYFNEAVNVLYARFKPVIQWPDGDRVIRLVKQKYTMLSGTLPVDMLSCRNSENAIELDKVLFVASCLANLCPSVVDCN
ncbi:hypothetical protein UPYG_G00052330 [Umbra pygmaea]|uniref:THAP-type domain-containing protein n=1 Tax=Umbra pygmaea TaxID=75934 RepID=A0ABD0XML6_UMBPY